MANTRRTGRAPSWSASNLVSARLGIYTRASDDQEETKTSTDAQAGRGESWAEEVGAVVVERYCDNDKSASWYAKKARTDFDRLLKDIAAGKLDLVWFWTLSRSQRRLDVYAALRDLCRANGVGWVIKNRLYDLNDSSDLRSLGIDAVNGEIQSLEISENVKLGLELAATKGKPHSHTTYGYRRIYENKKYKTQVPEEPQAGVVREIITRISNGDPISRIVSDFQARKIPSPSGNPKWARSTVRGIATNLAYIGTRVHEPVDREKRKTGERTETPNCWPAISDAENFEETFYRAKAILDSPERKTRRPGREFKHLLSHIARCDECGERLPAKFDKRPTNPRRTYTCPVRHVNISADDLDNFVRAAINAYLARPDVQDALAQGQSDDIEVIAARAEAAKLRGELEENRQAREAGLLTLAEYLRFKEALSVRISAAESRVEVAATPPILRSGPVEWDDLAIARQVVVEVVDIRVHPVGKGCWNTPIEERVTITPLIGPGM